MSEGEKQACSIRSNIHSKSSSSSSRSRDASVPAAGLARCQSVAAVEGHGFCEYYCGHWVVALLHPAPGR